MKFLLIFLVNLVIACNSKTKAVTPIETSEADYYDYGNYDPTKSNDNTDVLFIDYLDPDTASQSSSTNSGDSVLADIHDFGDKLFDNICLGKLKMEFSSTIKTIEKTAEQTKRNFRVTANENQDNYEIVRAYVEGTCCWKMCNRDEECDYFGIGEPRKPIISFVYKIKAMHCLKKPFLNLNL